MKNLIAAVAVVLGLGLAVYLSLPYFQHASFWLWLLVFYLFTLAVEMVLLTTRPVAGR